MNHKQMKTSSQETQKPIHLSHQGTPLPLTVLTPILAPAHILWGQWLYLFECCGNVMLIHCILCSILHRSA